MTSFALNNFRLGLFCLGLLSSALGAGISFPNKTSCVSPDLKWQIVRRSEPQKDSSSIHRLFLSRFGSQKESYLYGFDRSCEVLWTDNGERLAITDWLGSSLSDVYLVETDPIVVTRLEIPDISKIVLPEDLDASHVYWEAFKWEAPNQLLVRIFGHTDVQGPRNHAFTYYLLVDINSKETTLKRKEDKYPDFEKEKQIGSASRLVRAIVSCSRGLRGESSRLPRPSPLFPCPPWAFRSPDSIMS